MQCFGPVIVPPVRLGAFFHSGKYAYRLCRWLHFDICCCASPLRLSYSRVVWPLRMKLNGSKTKTAIVSRSRTMHPQSSALTIDGTVQKESDDFVISGVTYLIPRWLWEASSFCFQSSFSTLGILIIIIIIIIIILLKQDYKVQLANNKIQMAWLTSWLVVG